MLKKPLLRHLKTIQVYIYIFRVVDNISPFESLNQHIVFIARPVLYEERPVNVMRANVELGNLAHFVGVVNTNVLGTLKELRADMMAILPRHLTSKRYVFVSRRLEPIEPWREAHMIVKHTFVKSIRIKVLYGTGK